MDYLYRNLTNRNIEENEISPVNPGAAIPLPSFIRSASRGSKTGQSQYISLTTSLGVIWKWNEGNDIAIIDKSILKLYLKENNLYDLTNEKTFWESIEKNKNWIIGKDYDLSNYPMKTYCEKAFILTNSSREIVIKEQSIPNDCYEIISSDLLKTALEIFAINYKNADTIDKSNKNSTAVKKTVSYIESWQNELTDKIFEMKDYFIENNIDPKVFLNEYKELSAHLGNFIFPVGVKEWKKIPLTERTFYLKNKIEEFGIETFKEITDTVITKYNSFHKKTQIENVKIEDLMFILEENECEKVYER